MGSNYESAVRRVEQKVGRKLTDYEVILEIEEELYEQREKFMDGLLEIYDCLSESEQKAFDLGKLYGRMKREDEES
jgi:hypothetical protein